MPKTPKHSRAALSTLFASPDDLAAALDQVGYIPDRGLATAAFLAMQMGRPLFLEGDPGVGKTALAQALADVCRIELIRLQCYEGIDSHQALYDWDFSRQMMHLRAASQTGSGHSGGDDSAGSDELERSVYDERFLLKRPILRALEQSPVVLLVDEIDRADDEFEAFLMEALSEASVTVPELGTIRATVPPLTVLTSNRTREVHDALKRRCLYHWVEQPDTDLEIQIVRSRLPEVSDRLVREVVAVVQKLRQQNLTKVPGVGETLDWVKALQLLRFDRLNVGSGLATVGAIVKHREDRVIAEAVLRESDGLSA